MLALNDPRWSQLTTFFGESADFPQAVEEWLASVGSDQEENVYAESMFQAFLRQGTITNAAYAVVPWLVEVCKNHPTNCSASYLADIAYVEANRLTHGLHYHRKGTDETSDWLMVDYRIAIVEARNLIENSIDEEIDENWKAE